MTCVARLLALVCLLLAAGCATAPPAAPPSPAAPFSLAVERVVSPGGIEAWLASDATVPVIFLQAAFDGGSATDPPAAFGASAFLAAMLTEGAGDLDADAFKVRLEELNMGLGFAAGWDRLGMSLSTLTRNRDEAFALARLALVSPRFDANPLERLKRSSEVRLRQRETNPGWLADVAIDQAQIPGHPYARQQTLADVRAIDRSTLEARARALLVRDRLTVTVAGDIDAATLGPLLDQVFADLPRSGTPAPTPPAIDPAPGPKTIQRTLPQPQSLIVFSAPGIQDEHPDWHALLVATHILGGGGFSSRLMVEARVRQGLVYGVGLSPRALDHAAWIRGSAQTENAKAAQAQETIRAEMRRLAREGAGEQEVRDAIRYLTGAFPLALSSNRGVVDVLHGYHVAGRPVDDVNRRNARIAAVTKADVDRVAARLLDPDRFVFAIVGEPKGVADETSAPR